jgi:hypothetical protein
LFPPAGALLGFVYFKYASKVNGTTCLVDEVRFFEILTMVWCLTSYVFLSFRDMSGAGGGAKTNYISKWISPVFLPFSSFISYQLSYLAVNVIAWVIGILKSPMKSFESMSSSKHENLT